MSRVASLPARAQALRARTRSKNRPIRVEAVAALDLRRAGPLARSTEGDEVERRTCRLLDPVGSPPSSGAGTAPWPDTLRTRLAYESANGHQCHVEFPSDLDDELRAAIGRPGPDPLDDGDVDVAEPPDRLVGEPLRGGMRQVEATRIVAAQAKGCFHLPGLKSKAHR